MKRNVLAAILAVCLLATSFAGCDLSSFIPSPTEAQHPTEPAQQIGPKIKDAAAWDAAFASLELNKYTLEEVRRNSDHEVTSSTSYAYAENAAIYYSDDYDVYTAKNSDGTFTSYYHKYDINATLLLTDTSPYYYNRIWEMSAVCLSFAGQFEKFVFNEENSSYACEEMLEIPYKYPNGNEGVWYCSKAVISFIDGKVNALSIDFSIGNNAGLTYPVNTFRFFDIGTAVVEIPQAVMDAARPESMQPVEPVMQQNASPVQNAAAWDAAFNGLSLTNYSMTMIRRGYYGENELRHCVLTEDGAYYFQSRGGEYYTKANANGVHTAYYRQWGMLDIMSGEDPEGSIWQAISTMMTNNLTLAGNFDKFTYDAESGSYVCDEVLAVVLTPAGDGESSTIYSYKTLVQFVDGKLSTIVLDYRAQKDERFPVNTTAYFNIGTSKVEIPQEVLDNAQTPDYS